MCIADTRTMPSLTALFSTMAAMSSVMRMNSCRFFVVNQRYSVTTFILSQRIGCEPLAHVNYNPLVSPRPTDRDLLTEAPDMAVIRRILETALYCEDLKLTSGFYRRLLRTNVLLESERLV